ncbi:unnamed protein product [Phaedon cochleariae]|uniref:Uncharacterized protein n=1 Tax=Phaedon cochleariae TaxID=80249 RepID=A0A9P0DF11_PHACE|nr:unnamed protein product [Phaedon cochleariae]
MCILFLHVDPDPKEGDYRLVIATNRDEFYRRPAQPAFKDEWNIIAGRDLEKGKEGGMWLGFRSSDQENGKGKKHRFSCLLNVTGAISENACGRGFIVSDYLKSQKEFPQYAKQLNEKTHSGFNFVAVELSKDDTTVFHHSNLPQSVSIYPGKQTLAFGNSPIYSPYTKVLIGRYQFLDILAKGLNKDELEKELIELLRDRTRHLPDLELHKRKPEAHEPLSSIFIEIDPPGYGTRTHTVILIDYNWNLEFIEYTMEEPINISNPKWNVTRIKSRL